MVDTFKLRYHQSHNSRWITHADGGSIPVELSESIIYSIDKWTKATGKTLRDKEAFVATAKNKAAPDLTDPSPDRVEVELELKGQGPVHRTTPDIAPQTLKDWERWLKQLAESNPDEGVEELLPTVLQAQVFEFGEVDERRLAKENIRAQDLMNRGFLRMPYDTVIYRYTGDLHGRCHVIAKWNSTCLMWSATQDYSQREHYVPALSLMLSTKGTRQRTEPPSPKLQAKRLARGKSPLPTITHVDAEHYYSGVRNSESKGTHASPVPHLRRGHLRTLHNGHQVWIRDMLVNCKSADEATMRRLYEVKHA